MPTQSGIIYVIVLVTTALCWPDQKPDYVPAMKLKGSLSILNGGQFLKCGFPMLHKVWFGLDVLHMCAFVKSVRYDSAYFRLLSLLKLHVSIDQAFIVA